MLAVHVILPRLLSRFPFSFSFFFYYVSLFYSHSTSLSSLCPSHSECLPWDLHLLSDNMQTGVSDFASLVLSSMFPLLLHLCLSSAACLFKRHEKYYILTEASDSSHFFLFSFFCRSTWKKGQLYDEKCREKLNPLVAARHLLYCSENTEWCHKFLPDFFFLFFFSRRACIAEFAPLVVKHNYCQGGVSQLI